MTLQDFFYLVLSIAGIVFIIIFCFISFFIIQLLKSLNSFVNKLDETTKGVGLIKDNLKMGILSFLNIIFNIWTKKRG